MTSSTLRDCKTDIEAAIATLFPNSNNKLYDACRYALLNGGKRLRPAIALMVAEALDKGHEILDAAMAVEYFHTASLVVDDLPCMDDDDLRREKPSTHKVFGEATTLLVSYALIAEGYSLLAKNSLSLQKKLGDGVCAIALENASFNTGLGGATGGQFLDIFPPDLEISTLKEIVHKKTSSLFEIAFVIGWLYGGGAIEKLSEVKAAAANYGLAFQVADDLGDIEQDKKNGRSVNIAAVIGIDKASALLKEEAAACRQRLENLGIAHEGLIATLPAG